MHPLLVEAIRQVADELGDEHRGLGPPLPEQQQYLSELLARAEKSLRQNGTLEKIEERLHAADSYDRQWSIIFPGISKKA